MKYQCVQCDTIRRPEDESEYTEEGLLKCPGCDEPTDVWLLDEQENKVENPY